MSTRHFKIFQTKLYNVYNQRTFFERCLRIPLRSERAANAPRNPDKRDPRKRDKYSRIFVRDAPLAEIGFAQGYALSTSDIVAKFDWSTGERHAQLRVARHSSPKLRRKK